MEDSLTFMIVDDDQDDCDIFCEAVTKIDEFALCHRARNGEDALLKLRRMELQPDFIFLDLNMPRMNGIQCLAELKKDAKLKDIPVVILSTSSSQKDIDETSKLGAIYFITKPSDFTTLSKKLSFVIERIGPTLCL